MSITWSFHDEASDELVETAEWYADEREVLGEDFAEAIGAVLDRLRGGTILHLPVLCDEEALKGRLWRVLVPRFPYAIVFVKIDDEHFQIVAIAHLRRRPQYWLSRLPGR